MSLTMHDPDLDDVHRPFVVVRHRAPGPRTITAGIVVLVLLALVQWRWTGNPILATVQVLPGFWMLSRSLGRGASPPQPPALAVFEDGIKLPFDRLAPDRPSWEPWSFGFYAWDEVSRCGWSAFRPGRLCVYLKAAKYQSDLFGPADGSGLQDSPRILFFDVPEADRDAVEAAIRKRGHWAD